MSYRPAQLVAAVAAFALCLHCGGSDARAQGQVERLQRRLERIRRENRLRIDESVPPGQRTLVKYGGFYSFNYLSLDDANLENRILRQHELVGYARVNFDGVHDFLFRGRTGYDDFHHDDRFERDESDDNQVIDPGVERLFYRFDLQRQVAAAEGQLIDGNVVLQAGRDFVYWANGLVLSEVLDGAVLDLSYGDLDLRLLAGVTAHHGYETVDFDSSRPAFDDDTRRAFYGALLSGEIGPHRPFAYVLVQRDQNTKDDFIISFPDFSGGDPIVIDTQYDYNSYYLGAGVNGALGDRLLYAVEVVHERGDNLSNSFQFDVDDTGNPTGTISPIDQTEDDISAWAFDGRLDYLLADPRQTRVSAELIVASGDDDRAHTSNTFNGNSPDTRDRAFNAFGLLNTGVAFNPPVSNLTMGRVGVSTLPGPGVPALRRLQVGADVHVFARTDDDAPIDEPTEPGERYLGWEPDVFVNWRITSDVTLALRYGVFFPGGAIVDDEETRTYFFGGLTFAF